MLDNINPTLNFNSTSTSTTTTSNKSIQPNPTLSSSPFVPLSSSSKFNNSQNLNQQYQQQQEPSVIKFEHYYNNLDIFKDDDDDDDDAKNKRNAIELIDSDEIFDLIRSITDPEHPLTLEDLSVVSSDQITVTYPTTTNHTKIHHNNSHDDQLNYPSGHKEKDQEGGKEDEDEDEDYPHVLVRFTPTIPHCSMATLIGLTIRVRLLRSLPDQFKVDIKIKEGTHQSENSVNKQLNDKERVAAALENSHLLNVVQQCLSTAHLRGRKE